MKYSKKHSSHYIKESEKYNKMSSLERFIIAIQRKEPDMVPIIEWEVEESVREKIMPGKSMFDFYENIDFDAITIDKDIPWVEINSFIKKD